MCKQFFDVVENYADNRFARKGVDLQMNANSFRRARRSFDYSCMLCCRKNVGAIQCASCPIREAFLENGKIFAEKLSDDDKLYLKEERELL